ncbi:MAG: hypothetical protein HZB80_05705 [Deltaproteobacteria bacterium]|nr:hypothetical protein [Deltaproteobacteria bacterium]
MTEQINKRLIDEQVRMILERYLKKELNAKQGMDLLGLKRRQFFEWANKYRENPACWTIAITELLQKIFFTSFISLPIRHL